MSEQICVVNSTTLFCCPWWLCAWIMESFFIIWHVEISQTQCPPPPPPYMLLVSLESSQWVRVHRHGLAVFRLQWKVIEYQTILSKKCNKIKTKYFREMGQALDEWDVLEVML
jgi:hypothetical protein